MVNKNLRKTKKKKKLSRTAILSLFDEEDRRILENISKKKKYLNFSGRTNQSIREEQIRMIRGNSGFQHIIGGKRLLMNDRNNNNNRANSSGGYRPKTFMSARFREEMKKHCITYREIKNRVKTNPEIISLKYHNELDDDLLRRNKVRKFLRFVPKVKSLKTIENRDKKMRNENYKRSSRPQTARRNNNRENQKKKKIVDDIEEKLKKQNTEENEKLYNREELEKKKNVAKSRPLTIGTQGSIENRYPFGEMGAKPIFENTPLSRRRSMVSLTQKPPMYPSRKDDDEGKEKTRKKKNSKSKKTKKLNNRGKKNQKKRWSSNIKKRSNTSSSHNRKRSSVPIIEVNFLNKSRPKTTNGKFIGRRRNSESGTISQQMKRKKSRNNFVYKKRFSRNRAIHFHNKRKKSLTLKGGKIVPPCRRRSVLTATTECSNRKKVPKHGAKCYTMTRDELCKFLTGKKDDRTKSWLNLLEKKIKRVV